MCWVDRACRCSRADWCSCSQGAEPGSGMAAVWCDESASDSAEPEPASWLEMETTCPRDQTSSDHQLENENKLNITAVQHRESTELPLELMLTRIRVTGQAAVSARQCRRWGGKRNAVIILHIKGKKKV